MNVFNGWYTDTVDVYRNKTSTNAHGISLQAWDEVKKGIQCRIYNSHKGAPITSERETKVRSDDRLAVPLGTDIQSGDKLVITRGGAVGGDQTATYYAGDVMPYYEPVGGMFNGLGHTEIGLLQEAII